MSLITLPNPHLRANSKKVGYIDESIHELVHRMEQITLDWEAGREHEVGVALAAVQIDQLVRVVVIRSDFDNKEDKSFRAFINPQITKYEGELLTDFEGCLSVRDIYGKVPRYSRVRMRAQDLNGKEMRITADGFLARVFQHEIDHTNGKVFLDHIRDVPDAFYRLNEEGQLVQLDFDTDISGNTDLWNTGEE